jgi:hypothetical protein
VVDVFEDVSGRQFDVQAVPEEALRSQMESADDPIQRSLGALMVDYATGDLVGPNPLVEKLSLPRTTVRDFAAAVLK